MFSYAVSNAYLSSSVIPSSLSSETLTTDSVISTPSNLLVSSLKPISPFSLIRERIGSTFENTPEKSILGLKRRPDLSWGVRDSD